MSIEIQYLKNEDLVLFKTAGSYEVSDNIEVAKSVNAELDKHNCYKCIVDHRAANIIWNVADTYNRPNAYYEFKSVYKKRMAIVFKKLDKNTSFYEDVCRNRGLNISVFDDYEAAIGWLNQDNNDKAG